METIWVLTAHLGRFDVTSLAFDSEANARSVAAAIRLEDGLTEVEVQQLPVYRTAEEAADAWYHR